MPFTRLLVPLAVLALAGCGASDGARTAAGASASPAVPTTQDAASAAPRSEPLDTASAALCVANYSPAAVADRSFAFDGTIRAVGEGTSNKPDKGDLDTVAVTFDVTEWFRGGEGPTVTVDMGRGAERAVGDRLLVSGEPRWGGAPLQDAIAWGGECGGFTQTYDPAVAAEWRAATS